MVATEAVFGPGDEGDHLGTARITSPACTLKLPLAPPPPMYGRKTESLCTKLGGASAALYAPITGKLEKGVNPDGGAPTIGPLTRVAPPPIPSMNPSSE